jgi:hypothetical protein
MYTGPYVYYGIDKITLGIQSSLINYNKTNNDLIDQNRTKNKDWPELNGIIDISHLGNWTHLNIQWEQNGFSHIDFYNPWWSVLWALKTGIFAGVFKEPLSYHLFNLIRGIEMGIHQPISFLRQFMDTGTFKLSEYELHFDFIGYNPFRDYDYDLVKQEKNSIYTADYYKKILKSGKNKGKHIYTRRSILCIYDRGLKINSPFPIQRAEFRICDYRAKTILNNYDIYLSVPQFIHTHGEQIKSIVKRYLPEGSIDIDKEYIYQNMPILGKLIWLL